MIVRRPTDSTRHAVVHVSDYDGAVTCACGRVFAKWMYADQNYAVQQHVRSENQHFSQPDTAETER